MQIERLPDLVDQQVRLKELLKLHAADREMMQMRLGAVEAMLGKDTYSFNMIKAEMSSYENIIGHINKIEELQNKHLEDVKGMIEDIRKVLLSKVWYDQALGITEETRKEWTGLSLKEQDEMVARLSTILTWRHPCLLINPYNHEIVSMASVSDQLYIADQDDAVLQSALDRVQGVAKSMIRSYNIKNYNEMTLDALPQKQFGLVIVWQIFERLTAPYIKMALSDIRRLLRPGGKILFNFNDGDTVLGCRLATYPVSKSYMTLGLLEEMIKELDLEVTHCLPFDSGSSLVELTAPGQFATIKDQPGRGLVQRYET